MAGDPRFLFLIFQVQAITYQLAKNYKRNYPWELITAIVFNDFTSVSVVGEYAKEQNP